MKTIKRNFNLKQAVQHFTVLMVFCLFANVNLLNAQSWGEQTSGTSNNLHDISFIGERGFSVGDNGTVTGTSDGYNWNSYSSTTTNDLHAVTLIDNNGVIYGYGTGVNGTFIWWETGQTNWSATTLSEANGNNLNGLYFTDHLTGYLVGGSGTILKTTNGGLDWAGLGSGTTNDLNDVFFISNNRGFAVGGLDGVVTDATVRTTTDGGDTWTEANHNGTTVYNAIHFSNSNIGVAVGNSGSILTTSDGGSNWDESTLGILSDNLTDVYSANDTIFFATTQGGDVIMSKNGGESWEELETPVGSPLTGISFINSYTSYISGNNGVILSSCPKVWIESPQGNEGCAGEQITFINHTQGGTSYIWRVDDDTVETEETNLHYTFHEAGEYDVTLIAENQTCPDQLTIEMTILAAPAVDLGPDTTINDGQTYELDAGEDGVKYTWLRNGDTTGAGGQIFTVSSAGLYSVYVENELGCVSFDEVQIDVATSLAEAASGAANVNVYPNPATDFVNITYLADQPSEVAIYNILGKRVHVIESQNIGNVEATINLHDFNPGVYIIEINSGGATKNKRFIVE